MATVAGRVFISYAREDAGHIERVRALVARIRGVGIECELDEDAADVLADWQPWMGRGISRADLVVIVGSPNYPRYWAGEPVAGKGRGVADEARIIRDRITVSPGREVVVPVLFAGEPFTSLPVGFQGYPFVLPDAYPRLLAVLSGAQPLREAVYSDEVVARAIRLLKPRLRPAHIEWLLALVGVSASHGWPAGVDAASAAGRGPLLTFLVHAFLGDEAPPEVRRRARLPHWDVVANEVARGMVVEPRLAPVSLADLRPAPSTAAAMETLGLVVWGTTGGLPTTLAARVARELKAHAGLGGLEDVTIELGGRRLDGTAAVLAARGRAPEHRGLRVMAAAAWLEPRLDDLPDAVTWLCDGLGRDPFRADLLRCLDRERIQRIARAWAQHRLADGSGAALVALVDLRLVLGDDGGVLRRWAAQHAAPLRTWIDEMFATHPDEVSGDTEEAGRARRRVLERMDEEARLRWIEDNPGSVVAAALAGGAPEPEAVTARWLALLSPDATAEQLAVVRAHAETGDEHARAALARIDPQR